MFVCVLSIDVYVVTEISELHWWSKSHRLRYKVVRSWWGSSCTPWHMRCTVWVVLNLPWSFLLDSLVIYSGCCFRTPLCWFQDGESVLIGPELIQQTNEKVKKIQERLKTSLSKQISYANKRIRPLEFSAGDNFFFRVTLFTSVGRALKSKKLTPKFIRPYQILRRIGPVAYEIAFPPLANIHNIFHVSQLWKFVLDPSHILKSDSIQVKENLSFQGKSIRILDSQVKQLQERSITMVKVLWDPSL